MNKRNVALVLGTISVLAGCTPTLPPVEAPEPEPPAYAPEPESTSETPEANPEPEPAATEAEQVVAEVEAAVREIQARCLHVQQSSQLPISCQLDMVDGVARMQLVMTNRGAANTYMNAAEAELIVPFCNLSNLVQQPAGVVVALHQERVMRVGDCSTMQYSDWQSADPRVQQLTAAAEACQALEESRHPVGCSMGVLDEVPSLIVRYSSSQVSEAELSGIGRVVAQPFCNATSASGVEALVYLVEDDTRAKGFNCSTAEGTDWFEVRRPAAPPQHHDTPASTDGNTHSAPPLARQVVYERLPIRRQD